jgi:hypothetical protein
VIAAAVLELGGARLGPGAVAAADQPATTCGQPAVEVHATGTPRVDRRNIQHGIDVGEVTGRCVVLVGQFDVGVCVFCLEITGPVTLSGRGDPTVPNPNPRDVTVVQARGGVGLLKVNEPADAPAGLVRVNNIWWRGSTLIGLTMQNFHRGTLQFDHNRVTDVRERARFRFGIGGSTQILPGSEVLTGDLIVRDNYVDTTTNPFIPGDDNGIAMQGVAFDRIDISGNTAITNGESLEIEASTGSSVTIEGNLVSTTRRIDSIFAKVVDTVGFPRLHGGHPSALKMAGNDYEEFTIADNAVTVGGGSSTAVCIMQYMADPSQSAHASRTTRIVGNECRMDRIFAGVLGGWAGELPFFPQGTLDDAMVQGNLFTGSAAFGITMMDFVVRAAPANDLVNTSHGNQISDNDFTQFAPSRASIYFGASTHDNSFVGDPHGPVINLGHNNTVVTS